MILDYEQELTLAGGHDTDFAAGTEYGSKPYDQKAAADAAVGEPIHAYMQVLVADVNQAATIQIDIVASDTGASGGNEVVLCTRTFANANLTVAEGVRRVGICVPGKTPYRYLAAKITTAVGTADGGSLTKVWLGKASDHAPQNDGVNIG